MEAGGDPRVANAKGKRALDLVRSDSAAWKLMKEAKVKAGGGEGDCWGLARCDLPSVWSLFTDV